MDYLKTEQPTDDITYKAVESREVTLRQLRDGLIDVIDLDPDLCPDPVDYDVDYVHHIPSPASSSHTWPTPSHTFSPSTTSPQKRVRFVGVENNDDNVQPTKKRKTTGSSDTAINIPTSASHHLELTSSVSSTTHCPPRTLKKSLWYSENAAENMSRLSSLPSPESLLSDTSIDSFQEQQFQNGPSSYLQSTWSFENCDEPNTISSPEHFQFEAVTNNNSDLETIQSLSSGRSCDNAPEPLRKKRDDLERQGIEESRRLREENRRRKERASFAGDTNPAKHGYQRSAQSLAHQRDHDETLVQVDKTPTSSILNHEEDPALIEHLLDFAEDHRRSQIVLPTEARRPKRDGQTPSHRPARINPLSREAAEQWRTQDRHLGHAERSERGHSVQRKASCEAQSSPVEDKEQRVARILANSRWDHLQRQDREAEKRLLNTKFHGVDLQGPSKKVKNTVKPRARPRSATEIQNHLHRLMGTSNIATANQHSDGGHAATTNEPEPTSVGTSRPSLSRLNQVSSMASKLESFSKTPKAIPQEVFDNLPKQTDIESEDTPRTPRPGMFNQFSKEQQDLFVERDLKREREKDLEIIRSVFTIGAQLGALVPFDPNDSRTARQLSDIRGFAEAILQHDKSGKTLRAKIRSIRDFFKRRLDAMEQVPDDEAASNYLSILLMPELSEKLLSETAQVAGRIPFLTTECNKINAYYHARNPRVAALSGKKDSTGKGIGSRNTSFSGPLSAKQKLAQLRSTLDLYEKGSDGSDDETEVIDLGPSRDDRNEGEVSEEDEGESFTRPAGLETQTLAASAPSNVPSTEDDFHRQQDRQERTNPKSGITSQTSQSANEGLLQQMLTRQKQQAHLECQGVQKADPQIAQECRQRNHRQGVSAEQQANKLPEISDNAKNSAEYDIEENSSQEFDDTDLDDEGDVDDESAGPQCKRYIAKGTCNGLSADYDSSDYILGYYLDRKKARKQALSFSAWVREQMSKSGQDIDVVDDFKESISESKTAFEQRVVFGDDEKVSCRAWIEEELHRPSEEAYEKAKVRKACEGYDIWFVDWERTIKPHEEQDEDETPECESRSESDHSDLTVNESTLQGEIINADDLKTAHAEGQTDITGKDSEELSSKPSPSSRSTNSQPESLTSASETLISETDGDLKDVIMSDNNTSLHPSPSPDSLTAEDQNEDGTDLFGPDTPEAISIPTDTTPPPPPPPTELSSAESRSIPPASSSAESLHKTPSVETIVTRATGDHLRMFTTIAHANRHAKDVFMRWYIEHLPGLANQGFIEHEDEAMEEELRTIGNQSCWSREEEFTQERERDVPGETVKVEDKLRVWVRKGKCFGPSN